MPKTKELSRNLPLPSRRPEKIMNGIRTKKARKPVRYGQRQKETQSPEQAQTTADRLAG
jgi:hypothetical protein